MITERDRKILFFLNEFGYAKLNYIGKLFFDLKREREGERRGGYEAVRRRMKVLYDAKFVKRERDPKSQEWVYFLTWRGGEILKREGGDVFSFYTEIKWGNFEHNTKLIEVYIHLRKMGFEEFIGERRMRNKKIYEGIYPDLVMKKEGTIYFFEIELELKREERLEKKFVGYSGVKGNWKVFYLCKNDSIKKRVLDMGKRFNNVFEKLTAQNIESFLVGTVLNEGEL